MKSLMVQFEADAALRDVKIQVSVKAVSTADIHFEPANGDQIKLVAPAVQFTVKAVYGGKEIEINRFNTYVERTIAIPEGVDPNKITTGVIVTSDGKMVHVPTKIVQENGKYYAVIHSRTNSIYTVISNDKTFDDIKGHWAQTSIEDLAGRLVISGADDRHFLPGNAVTRAEFTAIIVRALGLQSAGGTHTFTDVRQDQWFADAVNTGVSYGLVKGYADGSFRPGSPITREEAMGIVARAMALAGMDTTITGRERDQLLASFSDSGQFSAWAREAAALTVRSGIISGDQHRAKPLQNISRAETAAIIERLLKQAGLN